MKRRRLGSGAVGEDLGTIEWRAPFTRSDRRQKVGQASRETYPNVSRLQPEKQGDILGFCLCSGSSSCSTSCSRQEMFELGVHIGPPTSSRLQQYVVGFVARGLVAHVHRRGKYVGMRRMVSLRPYSPRQAGIWLWVQPPISTVLSFPR